MTSSSVGRRPDATTFSDADLAVDRSLSDIAASFRFLLELTPVELVAARTQFEADGRPPAFHYRPLPDDPDLTLHRVEEVAVDRVEHAILATLLRNKARELQLQLEMLGCRNQPAFRALSVELFGAVSPGLLEEANRILRHVEPSPADPGPWLDAQEIADAAQRELDAYRRVAPDLEAHVEIREGSSGLMVSNGDLLIAPSARVSAVRLGPLLQHEVGVHLLTYVNGSHQPLRVLATGLADHEETQEGLAVLAEYLSGGLTATRLRQLAARVVAVHQMLEDASFPDVHHALLESGVPPSQAFTITMRVFRSGGLTKDAVYLRGLRELVDHVAAGNGLDDFWLGKMPLAAVPLISEMHRNGALKDPLLRPRFIDEPAARSRLADIAAVSSLADMIGDTT